MTPFIVPTVEELSALDDDALAAMHAKLLIGAADCEANAAGARDLGNENELAILSPEAFARTAKALMAQRKGERYVKPRPVVNFPTAVVAMKSTMRMMGLLDDFHQAFTSWHLLDDDADDTHEWAELMRCHAAIVEANEVAA